jgi:thymidylate synthase ThyX
MKVTLASIAPSSAAVSAGCPSLTPELLASTAARYSRNDEGLDAILALLDRSDPEKSIDAIFRMVDYGHASIGDMAPAAMFIDGISVWLAYHLWSRLPRASGQETSTRYVRFDDSGMVSAEDAGVPEALRGEWRSFLRDSISRYESVAAFWEEAARREPELMGLPSELLAAASAAPDGKDALRLARMRRNFAFDRARYWIPGAALTNVMLVMGARDWVALIQDLLSSSVPEAKRLGATLADRLSLVTPRLTRHAIECADRVAGHLSSLSADSALARRLGSPSVTDVPTISVSVDEAVLLPSGSLSEDLGHHPHRYSWVGREAERVQVRYAVSHVAFAELRDLNRHRTGYKFAPFVPVGFYGAGDEVRRLVPSSSEALSEHLEAGLSAAIRQRGLAEAGLSFHPYFSLLGTQVPFEHGTTLDKLRYEIELRTGTGAHYRYASHLRAVHDALVARLPALAGRVLLGSAEPE